MKNGSEHYADLALGTEKWGVKASQGNVQRNACAKFSLVAAACVSFSMPIPF